MFQFTAWVDAVIFVFRKESNFYQNQTIEIVWQKTKFETVNNIYLNSFSGEPKELLLFLL